MMSYNSSVFRCPRPTRELKAAIQGTGGTGGQTLEPEPGERTALWTRKVSAVRDVSLQQRLIPSLLLLAVAL